MSVFLPLFSFADNRIQDDAQLLGGRAYLSAQKPRYEGRSWVKVWERLLLNLARLFSERPGFDLCFDVVLILGGFSYSFRG